MPARAAQRGVVLLTVLFVVLATTLAASALVVSYTTQMRREKEAQLLFAGDQFRRAITSYYNAIPQGGARGLPPTLQALVHDDRFPKPIHHLRRIYPDPITGQADWELLEDGPGIIGVRSRSKLAPLKSEGFGAKDAHLRGAATYSGWEFRASR
jgi:type II secretory pathway pseudopilin PulG